MRVVEGLPLNLLCFVGDGIGPEISKSVKRIFEANLVPIVWEDVDVTPFLKNGVTTIPDAARESVNKNKVALKGTLMINRRV